jgi:hypothetical protein
MSFLKSNNLPHSLCPAHLLYNSLINSLSISTPELSQTQHVTFAILGSLIAGRRIEAPNFRERN